jgi:ketosteroid isomerase-like protein
MIPMTDITAADTTGTVVSRHLGAIAARDLDQLIADYTEASVLITPDATFQGLEGLRGFFAAALNLFTPEVMADFMISKQEVAGEIAYLFWSAGPKIPFATDSFLIRDGKIMVQTFTAQIVS